MYACGCVCMYVCTYKKDSKKKGQTENMIRMHVCAYVCTYVCAWRTRRKRIIWKGVYTCVCVCCMYLSYVVCTYAAGWEKGCSVILYVCLCIATYILEKHTQPYIRTRKDIHKRMRTMCTFHCNKEHILCYIGGQSNRSDNTYVCVNACMHPAARRLKRKCPEQKRNKWKGMICVCLCRCVCVCSVY